MVVTLDAGGAVDDMAVGEHQPVRRDHHARAGAAVPASSPCLDVEPNHGGTDAVDHVDDGARISIKQCLIFRRNRRMAASVTIGSILSSICRISRKGLPCDAGNAAHRAGLGRPLVDLEFRYGM